jgi:hypothetical protein
VGRRRTRTGSPPTCAASGKCPSAACGATGGGTRAVASQCCPRSRPTGTRRAPGAWERGSHRPSGAQNARCGVPIPGAVAPGDTPLPRSRSLPARPRGVSRDERPPAAMIPHGARRIGQLVVHQHGEGAVAVIERAEAVRDPHHPIGAGQPGDAPVVHRVADGQGWHGSSAWSRRSIPPGSSPCAVSRSARSEGSQRPGRPGAPGPEDVAHVSPRVKTRRAAPRETPGAWRP